MDKDNKLKASLNAYMAKHQLNTNATSVAIGVSVPTLRKALRGEKVSRKTTAKIESIIASGKVPTGAKTTKTTKTTAAKKPAAKATTRKAATKTTSTSKTAAKRTATGAIGRQAQNHAQPTSTASTSHSQAATNAQENVASTQAKRRTTTRVNRATATTHQASRTNNQHQSQAPSSEAPTEQPTTSKRPTNRNHRFTIRQQPDVATQAAQAEEKKRQAQINSQAKASTKPAETEERNETTARHTKQHTPVGKTETIHRNSKNEHEPVRRERRNVRIDRNKSNSTRRPGRPRQNRFAANADPQNWQPMTQPTSTSASQSTTSQEAGKRHVPAVLNKAETHTPSVIRSSSNDHDGATGATASSTSNNTSANYNSSGNQRASYGVHTEAPLVTGKQLQLFIDESFEERRPDPRMMHMGIAAIFPEGDDESLAGFRNALYPYGWEPGDEVKARGKQVDALTQLIKAAKHEHMGMYTVFSRKTTYPDFAPSMEYLYPYIGATLHVLRDVDTSFDSIVIMIDHRNELEGNQLVMGADIVSRYLTLSLERPIKVRFEFADSREHLGLQLSDFVANAALRLSHDELSLIGINPMPELGVSQHDQLVRLTLLGLQQVVMGVRAERAATPSKHSQPDRFMQLIFDATYTDSDRVRGALPVVKSALEQLIDVLPNARVGQISVMPNQSWYDMTARMAGLLRYINKDPKPYGKVLAKIESVTKTAADELEMALDSDSKTKR
ncbi:DUF3800 domain-containing protein [Lacticaseibacillus chiayiensis]|uniref:DUF3800 domain-containing protein n=1 Tax=Lacticaseibacillus chiayiensis TaxID=2100821 RepID=UPI00177AA694|nr:DUF3800 domain-containing protein [Lacticaseibacillus chiayiensis]